MTAHQPAIKVTRGDLSSLPAIEKISKQVHTEAILHRGTEFGDVGEFVFNKAYYQSMLENPEVALLVAKINKRICGYALMEEVQQRDDLISIPFCEVLEIAVDRRERSKGVGTALWAAIEGWTQAKNLKVIQLAVSAFNEPAVRFYSHLGLSPLMLKMEKVLD